MTTAATIGVSLGLRNIRIGALSRSQDLNILEPDLSLALIPMALQRDAALGAPLRVVGQIHGLGAVQMEHDAVAVERGGQLIPLSRLHGGVVLRAGDPLPPARFPETAGAFGVVDLLFVAGERLGVGAREHAAVAF